MAEEYDVGYRRPPKATRFKTGQSGNPKGRPRGSTNLATDLSAELNEQITVREGGQARRITKQRALIKSLTAQALKGDVRATSALLALYARVISEPGGGERVDRGGRAVDPAPLRASPRRLARQKGTHRMKIDRDLANAFYRTDFGA